MDIRDPRIHPNGGDELHDATQRVLVQASSYDFASDSGTVTLWVSPLQPFGEGSFEAFALHLPLAAFRQKVAQFSCRICAYVGPDESITVINKSHGN